MHVVVRERFPEVTFRTVMQLDRPRRARNSIGKVRAPADIVDRELLAPDDPSLLEPAGIAALKLGYVDRASSLLALVTSRGGADWRVWNALGVAADLERQWARADECYNHALQLAPNEAGPVNNRGWSLLLRGNWKEAQGYFEQAIRLDPNNALAWCARATAYNGSFLFDHSIADATEAIRLAPELYFGYDARGYGFWHRGNATGQKADYQQSIADFTESIRLRPAALDSYFGRVTGGCQSKCQ